jgi:TonB-linked SusC/RagA family outer membrane protein
MQGSGQPSDNQASMNLRGHAPLVLIDGFPRDISSITMTEIESISVLKDAVASAIYGVRGANGVINVVTKRGKQGKLKVTGSYQFGLSTKFRSPEFANSALYAEKLNSALLLDGLNEKYSDNEIESFRNGNYPYAFPNVNWQDKVYNDFGTNHQLNLNFTGGGEKFKYFTALAYSNDRGLLDDPKMDERYDASLNNVCLNLRTNLDVKISESTRMTLDIMGRLNEDNGPNNPYAVYSSIYRIPSAAFPVKDADGVWGGSRMFGNNNPLALLSSSGHHKNIFGTTNANLALNTDLSNVLDGLSAYVAVAVDTRGQSWENSSKTYRYVDLQANQLEDGTVVTMPEYYDVDSQVLSHSSRFSNLYVNSDVKARLSYSQNFNNHELSFSGMFNQQSYVVNGRNRSQKRQTATAYATYAYKEKYFAQAVVSYSGSAVFPKGERFETYPAVSVGWNIAKESFFNNRIINDLKITSSYGISGFDGNIEHDLDIQSYVGSGGYLFGRNVTPSYGMREGALPVESLTTEKSKKFNVALEVGAFDNRLNLMADAFIDKRYDLLVSSAASVSGVIGIDVPLLNQGKTDYKGIDLSLNWSDKINDFAYRISGTYSFVRSKVINYNEPYREYDYLKRTGNRAGQYYGLEAIGFFKDNVEINNSPVQTFSDVRPGDIKYKDQNGDNVIDQYDVVKMYRTGMPEIYYGLSFDLSYKNFGVFAQFQGVENRTVNLLSSPLYRPLVNHSTISKTFLDNETPWTGTEGEKATMPRLTTQDNKNNYRTSNVWLRDGDFLKLRTLQIYYNLPNLIPGIANVKLYATGTNLFSIDHIKHIDPEQLHGTYPSTRSFWLGANISF